MAPHTTVSTNRVSRIGRSMEEEEEAEEEVKGTQVVLVDKFPGDSN